MPQYKIFFVRSARKELEKLQLKSANRIVNKIELLSKSPRPKGCKKLQGPDDLWRIRIGDYRIIYSINDKKRLIEIMIVRHRSEAYK